MQNLWEKDGCSYFISCSRPGKRRTSARAFVTSSIPVTCANKRTHDVFFDCINCHVTNFYTPFHDFFELYYTQTPLVWCTLTHFTHYTDNDLWRLHLKALQHLQSVEAGNCTQPTTMKVEELRSKCLKIKMFLFKCFYFVQECHVINELTMTLSLPFAIIKHLLLFHSVFIFFSKHRNNWCEFRRLSHKLHIFSINTS